MSRQVNITCDRCKGRIEGDPALNGPITITVDQSAAGLPTEQFDFCSVFCFGGWANDYARNVMGRGP